MSNLINGILWKFRAYSFGTGRSPVKRWSDGNWLECERDAFCASESSCLIFDERKCHSDVGLAQRMHWEGLTICVWNKLIAFVARL